MTESATRQRIVVVGANAAGMSAAHQALRRAAAIGRRVEVVVLEATDDTSYSACGIPYWLAGDVDDDGSLVARTATEHRRLGVDLVLGARVAEIDRRAMTVTYDRTGESPTRLGYDDLVLATGATPIVPPWALDGGGSLLPGVHPVGSLEDGRVWERLLDGGLARPRQATVAGGGYIGIEMAEVLLRRGLATRLVTRTRVLRSLDADMGSRVEHALRNGGVELATQTTIAALDTTAGRVTAAVTESGHVLPTDVVLLGLGVRPETSLGAAAGLEVGEHGGYLPDPTGQVAEHVWAVGDCCEVVNRLTGERVFEPLGTHANKLGRVAGDNIGGGGEATFAGVVGTAITRFAAADSYVEMARTGLNTEESECAGLEVTSLVTEGTTASGYMPEAHPIAIKVLADTRDGRLTGMQIVGGHQAGKRIDIAAMALWTGQTVADVAEADLAYAPPFATAWEITQIACRRLAERL